MMTTEKQPETPDFHEDDRVEKVAHLFHKWQFFHTDTLSLTVDQATRAQVAAHKDLHSRDIIDETTDEK